MDMAQLLEKSPVVAAIKDDEGLEKALLSDCSIVFILYGNICSISEIVSKVIGSGKAAFVHADLINGLSMKDIAIDFIKNETKATGIISTKPVLIKRAKELSLLAVQRTFLIDSMALENMKKQIESCKPDALEIMPGIMPEIIKKIDTFTDIPIIAGGLLSNKKEIMADLEAGADAVSTTSRDLWNV